jgi:biopolymer transport protein ExbD
MKNTRRLRRMARAKKHRTTLNLTSLMDVFTILVFFLLVNQSAIEVLEPPKEIKLPDSVVESKPRPTVTMLVSGQSVMVQGEIVASIDEVLTAKDERIAPVIAALMQIRSSAIGVNPEAAARNDEIVILADKAIPFKILQRLMSTCAISGYTKISLAVIQKATQS